MKKYEFATFDPRNIPAAIEANDKIFSNPNGVVGIEITVPALAGRCDFNIDPQHTGSNAELCAIEVATGMSLPQKGMTLATIRADLDSVGSMAILNLRANNQELTSDIVARIEKIANFDKFANGPYPGPRQLPALENLWPEGKSGLEGLNEIVLDFKVQIHDRVAIMEKWLLTGEAPREYEERAEVARAKMVAALENNEIKIQPFSIDDSDKVDFVVVESGHFFATQLGYMVAPVVIASNPCFKQGPAEPYKKFTICAYRPEHADIKSALAELAALEPGWGGSLTIGGSPQGVSSILSIEEVVNVVKRHINQI